MKKSSERPVVSQLPDKNEKDWKHIKESFLSSLNEEITNEKLQMTFCKEWSAEYEYRLKTLQGLYLTKESYGR